MAADDVTQLVLLEADNEILRNSEARLRADADEMERIIRATLPPAEAQRVIDEADAAYDRAYRQHLIAAGFRPTEEE